MEVQLIAQANYDDEREVVSPLELLLGLFNLDKHSDFSEFALFWTNDVAIFKCTCGIELESRFAKCRGYVSVPSDFSSVSKSANMTLEEYIAREMVSQKDLPPDDVYCSRCKIHGPNPLHIKIWKHYFEFPYYLVLSLDPTGIYNLPEQLTITTEKQMYGDEEDDNEEEPVKVVKYRLIAKIMRGRDYAVEPSYSAIFRKNLQLFHYSQLKHKGYAQGEMENSLSIGEHGTIAAFYVKEDIIIDVCTRPILIYH